MKITFLVCETNANVQNTGWMKHKPESGLLGKISIISDMQITPPLWQKAKELKSLLRKVKEESEKAGLKLTFKKLRLWHPVPSLHGK